MCHCLVPIVLDIPEGQLRIKEVYVKTLYITPLDGQPSLRCLQNITISQS
jgi:hypothetical protein